MEIKCKKCGTILTKVDIVSFNMCHICHEEIDKSPN